MKSIEAAIHRAGVLVTTGAFVLETSACFLEVNAEDKAQKVEQLKLAGKLSQDQIDNLPDTYFTTARCIWCRFADH